VRLRIIGSGSTGNVLYVEAENTRVLVDVGLSARETARRLGHCGIDPGTIDAIVLTHEHSDHARGVPVFATARDVPVYATPATRQACQFGRHEARMRFVDIHSSQTFVIGAIEFSPFTVPHDAVDSFALTMTSTRTKVAFVTDLGYITRLVSDRVRGADVLIIESNHDVEMLKICPRYPWSLKQRVLSKHGHLSNAAVAEFLQRDFDGGAAHIVLAHLSKNTNDPQLARVSALQALDRRDSPSVQDAERRVKLADPDRPGDWLEL
jgi:phosphoribosyl 1,2-cyclic phosphodiesterase